MQPIKSNSFVIIAIALTLIAIIIWVILRFRKLKMENTVLSAYNQNLQHELEVMEETLASDVGTVNHVSDREPLPGENYFPLIIDPDRLPFLGGNLLYKAQIHTWNHVNNDYFIYITPTKSNEGNEKYLLHWRGDGWFIEPVDDTEDSTLLDERLYSEDLSKKIAKFIKDGRINHEK